MTVGRVVGTAEPPVQRPTGVSWWRRAGGWTVNIIVVVLIVGTVVLPAVADANVQGLETPPVEPSASLPPLVRGTAKPLLDMPAVTPGGIADQAIRAGRILSDPQEMRAAIDQAARSAFHNGDTTAFWNVIGPNDEGRFFGVNEGASAPYPYRYPPLDAVLDTLLPEPVPPALAPDVNDLAALLIILAVDYPEFNGQEDYQPPIPATAHAAAAAFDLLNRARATTTSCPVQLDLAFLLSTDSEPQDDLIATEFGRAHDVCPGDPTPLWLLGQFQLQRAYVIRPDIMVGQALERDALLPRPFATFQRLQRELPASAAGWSGQADAEVKLAEEADAASVQPFTSRHRYEQALTLYQRAAELDGDPGILLGQARALTGLGRYRDAAAMAARARAIEPTAAAFQTQVTLDLERSGQFGQAADDVAGQPAAQPLPSRRSFISRAARYQSSPTISIGIERLAPVTLVVSPPPGRGALASVYDFSFIPAYRVSESLLTTFQPWCRQQSRLRDLILAGRDREVLQAAAAGVRSDEFVPGYTCSGDSAQPMTHDTYDVGRAANALYRLAAVAAAESGGESTALGWLEKVSGAQGEGLAGPGATYDADDNVVDATEFLYDLRQNLWRFAGDLPRAAAVTLQWTLLALGYLAWDRAGEVAFNQQLYAEAARDFARSSQASTAQDVVSAIRHATAQLKEGAALGLAHQDAQATTTLSQAANTGTALESRIGPENWADEGPDSPGAYRGALVAFYAADQLGDVASARARLPGGGPRLPAGRESRSAVRCRTAGSHRA